MLEHISWGIYAMEGPPTGPRFGTHLRSPGDRCVVHEAAVQPPSRQYHQSGCDGVLGLVIR